MSQVLPDLFRSPPDVAPRSPWRRECSSCGACCAAPDITALHKPLGVACRNLDAHCRCQVYLERPDVCRNYRPDWVCGEVAPLPSLEARVARFLELYQLTPEHTFTSHEAH
ncbi:YkgJ family cysteine cluster protein [Deinococcus peraridilitoris]|uniref:Uncharacterized protein n=1 Tax=Deinococcus peraridilitoris (strain DSM 19664 / LMG 22246 / CIP 109416 / KR-200) TaxID=937777 RepID=L0A4Q5_DEIPD|nr:YkgJ family cysteine cluster protein [Deinococcus peraridilitoris]AFZ68868.1 hypothetical protein Deipe_3435 [Deinococcus peraridilitoris DSM 19664]